MSLVQHIEHCKELLIYLVSHSLKQTQRTGRLQLDTQLTLLSHQMNKTNILFQQITAEIWTNQTMTPKVHKDDKIRTMTQILT